MSLATEVPTTDARPTLAEALNEIDQLRAERKHWRNLAEERRQEINRLKLRHSNLSNALAALQKKAAGAIANDANLGLGVA